MPIPTIQLKKGEDRRIRAGHPWVFSNEIATSITPLKNFSAGQEVIVQAHDQTPLGLAYINPHSLITARIFTRHLSEHLDLTLLRSRLQIALALRLSLFKQPYYRLVFSEGDELPGLIVDRFGDHLVVQINTAGMENVKELIAEALLSTLPNTLSILLRNDSLAREYEGLETYIKPLFAHPPEEINLEENQIHFATSVWKGQKTGWFYDHRLNRARLTNYVKNKTVLDVFSYLGAWGIQAACYGAQQVACIDSSQFACDLIVKNAKTNQVEDKINVICADAFDAMKSLFKINNKYDVIILDPPAFVKKMKDRKEGLIAYQRLNELALKLLHPAGILISCSCSMHVSMQDLVEMMQRLAFRLQIKLQLLERGHQSPDHPIHIALPETDYLKMIIVRKEVY